MSTNTKPFADWTLGEVKTECRSLESCVECRLNKDGQCRLSPAPQSWDLTEKHSFTEDELVQAHEIRRVFGRADTIKRTDDGALCYGGIILNSSMLPSILPGQSVTIADIIGKDTGPG